MFKRCLLAENKKLHASPVWLMFFILPVLSAGYGTMNYLQNLAILKYGWGDLWTQLTLFYAMFFFPAMVAVYAAYLWRLEHLGHNWNWIMAVPVPPFDLFLAKFAVVMKMVVLTQGFTYLLYLFCGRVACGFDGWPPFAMLLYLLRGTLGGCAVVAAQLLLSMLVRSLAVPVLLAMGCSVVGMYTAAQGKGLWWPYALMQWGMNANKTEDTMAGQYAPFLFACLAWCAVLFAAAALLLQRRDVRAE